MNAKPVWLIERKTLSSNGAVMYLGEGDYRSRTDDCFVTSQAHKAAQFSTRKVARWVINYSLPVDKAHDFRAEQHIIGKGRVTWWHRITNLIRGRG